MTNTQQEQVNEQASEVQETQLSETAFIEYWGTDDIRKWHLPDQKQYFEFKIMAEGERAKYQRLTNQDLTIQRDQTAKVRMDPATERHTIIKTSVVGWFLYKGGKPSAFDNSKLEQWLSKADPKMVDDLEFTIRMANPWMQSDMSVKDIDKEVIRLEEMRRQAVDREAGEDASTSK